MLRTQNLCKWQKKKSFQAWRSEINQTTQLGEVSSRCLQKGCVFEGNYSEISLFDILLNIKYSYFKQHGTHKIEQEKNT